MVKKPAISKELLDYLIEVFPDRCPDLSRTEKEVWFAAGQAGVVRHLSNLFETQLQRAMTE